MNKSYAANYLRIYFWQGISIALRFIAMFIVTPFISKDMTTYGIYAICVSVTIFLNYADLGFLKAGQKYATESFARGDREEEMKDIGIGAFILAIFSFVFMVVVLYLGLNPEMLIKGLDTPDKVNIASRLLVILAVFVPFNVISRMTSIIFAVRLEDYIIQRISLITSAITIMSTFYFFSGGRYNIVGYYLFSQSAYATGMMLALLVAAKRYQYDLLRLFSYIKFDKRLFAKTSNLAYSGLYLVFAWILFYELDKIFVGRYLGAEKTAIFAIAFSFLAFMRMFYGIIYGPFAVRVNHFTGQGDDKGLNSFCRHMVIVSAPIVVIPTVALCLFSKPLVLSWVGADYIESIKLTAILALYFSFSFVTYPVSMYIWAKERLTDLYFTSSIQPLIFWVGVLLTINIWGLLSLVVFKVVAVACSAAYYLLVLSKTIGMNNRIFLEKICVPLIPPLLFMSAMWMLFAKYLPADKSKENLLIVLFSMGCFIFLSMLVQYGSSSTTRQTVRIVYNTVFRERANGV